MNESSTNRPSAHSPGKAVQVDSSGVSLAWKPVWVVLGFFIASGALSTVLGLATVEGLSDHNAAAAAHQVVLEKDAEPMAIATAVKAQHAAQKAHRREYQKLADGYEIVVTVKLDLDTDRAERLADRAADKIRQSARSREVWKTVRDHALQNLRGKPKRPIRAGLERYLD